METEAYVVHVCVSMVDTVVRFFVVLVLDVLGSEVGWTRVIRFAAGPTYAFREEVPKSQTDSACPCGNVSYRCECFRICSLHTPPYACVSILRWLRCAFLARVGVCGRI